CGYPSNFSVPSYQLSLSEDNKNPETPAFIYNVAGSLTQLLPAIFLPILTFLLVIEIRNAQKARKRLMSNGTQKENAKSDNTTTVIMLMTVSSMLSEGSYGILNFVSFCLMQNYDEYAEILSFFYFLQGLLDIFVTLNTVSHCFISLAVSTQYQNAVTATFPFLSNSKKHTNTVS
ncbi:hypothetical protein CRE_07807, partial [Caenorhabditis remanei]